MSVHTPLEGLYSAIGLPPKYTTSPAWLPPVFAAVEDASLWPVILDRIAEAVHGQESILFTSFPEPSTQNVSCIARMDPAALVPYVDYYASVNVLAVECDRMFPDGTVRYSHIAVPDKEFERTEFYNDYFLLNGMHYSFGIKVPLPDQEPAYLLCVRAKVKGPFSDSEGTVFEALLPHLRRALELHLKFCKLKDDSAGLEFSLDALGHAVFGLNRNGKVVLANRHAEKIALDGGRLMLVNGRLRATEPGENARLQLLLSDVVSTGVGNGLSAGGSILLNRSSGNGALRLVAMPFRSKLLSNSGQLAAIVFVSDPAATVPSRCAVLASLYRLTPTEARFAELLAGGKDVAAVAELLGITLETGRFHLKRVFAKTQTGRQTELMRLMLSLPGQ